MQIYVITINLKGVSISKSRTSTINDRVYKINKLLILNINIQIFALTLRECI